MRVALIAPKNSPEERAWLGSFFPFPVEEYRPRKIYDVVLFWNLSPEIERIRMRSDALLCAIGIEPEWLWPHNYNPDLIQHLDFYSSYKTFADERFRGTFHPFVYFAAPEADIRLSFQQAMTAERTHDFIQFARHDPNIRRQIGEVLKNTKSVLAGPLFDNPVGNKVSLQQSCRFEFITENVINDWYMTEKVPESLMAGCVPIYYGCTRAAEVVDPDLFVDMNRFGPFDGDQGIRKVIDYCLRPGVYEEYAGRIRERAEEILVKNFSLEHTVVEPIARFLAPFNAEGFTARKKGFGRAWGGRR